MKELTIIEKQDEKQICYIEDTVVKEFYKELNNNIQLEGNIYAGIVKSVHEGMQAAFVDIGENRNAFLHIKDLLPKESVITGNKFENLENYKIKDYIKVGQSLLLQVKKDSSENKGARVSTNIQVPGRFVIILPENDFVTISEKIENNKEKDRLKKIAEKLKGNKKIGIIIRTAAEGREKKLIEKDFNNTIKNLKIINDRFNDVKDNKEPQIIKKNNTILKKILLDLVDNNLDRILVNTISTKQFVEKILDKFEQKIDVKLEENLENKYDILDQISKIDNRKIWLKCGGFIIIDKTEALTAIDVNSGKFTGKKKIEDTALKVNKEASIEIAKQIRLRDIGGIIVIDYINMEEEDSKEEIIKVMKNELRKDRAKTQIVDFTKLNLLELTRNSFFIK